MYNIHIYIYHKDGYDCCKILVKHNIIKFKKFIYLPILDIPLKVYVKRISSKVKLNFGNYSYSTNASIK